MTLEETGIIQLKRPTTADPTTQESQEIPGGGRSSVIDVLAPLLVERVDAEFPDRDRDSASLRVDIPRWRPSRRMAVGHLTDILLDRQTVSDHSTTLRRTSDLPGEAD
jgi:hypothetical protein